MNKKNKIKAPKGKIVPLKGKIEINLAGRRLGDRDLPGKSGSFDNAADAAEFLEQEQAKKPRRKK